ncbi:hypothetical protein [Rhizobium leguminosarum]|uniref:hypothetical protein n=1 Tax=Rhizobium leguminosarum TaxID=384 RepID=UPI001441BF6C|nr:hypothetical protein [Rhizobium leguminosarum]MBY5863636.1 hypothetical protein [Rhizobium leguminosarum]NKM04515.1 hypothetical protein [Rhizobium leguminosarum bv. viciae]
MNLIKHLQNVTAAAAVLMMVAAPMFAPTPAEARRAVVGCGARGCAAVGNRGAVAVTRPPVRRGVVVVNPRRYWPAGGAIAAGAAIGFIAGAAAASVAGTPPKSGMCWYYTDSTKKTGFWDVCPR